MRRQRLSVLSFVAGAACSAMMCAVVLFGGTARAQTDAGKRGIGGESDAIAVGAARASASGPEIVWRVENPFRLFMDPSDTDIHRTAFNDLTIEERTKPVLTIERALSEHSHDGWASRMIKRTCWDARTNVYKCAKAGEAFVTPTHHMVVATLENFVESHGATCSWNNSPIRLKKSQSSKTITQSCDKSMRVRVPYPHGAALEVHIDGKLIAKTVLKVNDILVVGMGDSVGSGEGNPDTPVQFSDTRTIDYGNGEPVEGALLSGYPARAGAWRNVGERGFARNRAQWIDRACHRSLYSYQLRTALQLAIEVAHRAVTFVGVACSGAEVTFGMFLRYKGNEWVPNPPQYSQISAVARAQCGSNTAKALDLPEAYHIRGAISELKGGLVLYKCPRRKARRIDLLLVSIGGNDIGFARMLANAILTDKSMLRYLGGWMGEVHGRREARVAMSTLDERLKSLNRAFHNLLHVSWRQSDRIILTGYPTMALMGDGLKVCPDGSAGMDVLPIFSLSSRRARESQTVAEELNAKMKRAAARHRWTFVDRHRKEFNGRGVCAGSLASGASSSSSPLSSSAFEELRLPRKINGVWVPYNPSQYRAYVSRKRWIRTPNDAFMTDNFHVSNSILQKVLKLKSLRKFQLLLASTYSGAFHPSAEGQAAIADAVVVKARKVLEKYRQGGK